MAFNFFGKKKKQMPKPVARESAADAQPTAPSVPVAVGSNVLKSFHVSEKSTRGQAYNQYTFVVAQKATKTDVKHAVQRAFKVQVTDVSVIRLPAKHRAIGRYRGATPGIKKAIVTLKEGQVIAQAQP